MVKQVLYHKYLQFTTSLEKSDYYGGEIEYLYQIEIGDKIVQIYTNEQIKELVGLNANVSSDLVEINKILEEGVKDQGGLLWETPL